MYVQYRHDRPTAGSDAAEELPKYGDDHKTPTGFLYTRQLLSLGFRHLDTANLTCGSSQVAGSGSAE